MFDDQMAGNKSGTNWSFVVNLANSIIGVAVLAFPLCFKQCGVVLGLFLLSGCACLAYTSCCLLAKAASVTKKRSYEYLAFHIFGSSGKLMVEICSAGFLLGTLIAFFVIIGDICPEILSEILEIQNSTQLRTSVLITLGLLVILPLCMKSNLESISNLSTMSLVFYSLFAIRVIISSLHHVSTGEFVTDVKYWDLSGVFRSLPIFAVSYACQIQLFLVYHSTPDISIPQIGGLVWRAILLSSTIYFAVGYFGYLAFYDKEVSGDIMMNYETTILTGLIKLGFVSSTILSFPLVVYPCRCSLYTLISTKNLHENLGGTVHIPSNLFKYITCFIVLLTLVIGILVPKVEFVLGIMGSTLGSIICFIFPAIMFLRVVSKDTPVNMFIAKAVLFLGFLILIVSTWATLSNVDMETHLVDLNRAVVHDSDSRFDLHNNNDDDVKHLPPITAPPGIAQDIPLVKNNNWTSTKTNSVAFNDVKPGEVVRSNLAIDLANANLKKPDGEAETKRPDDGSMKELIKRDEQNPSPALGKGDKMVDEPTPDGNSPKDNEAVGDLPLQKDEHLEMANMKKLLNLPKPENEQNQFDSNSTSDTSEQTSSLPSSSSPPPESTSEVLQTMPERTKRLILDALKPKEVDRHKTAENQTKESRKHNKTVNV